MANLSPDNQVHVLVIDDDPLFRSLIVSLLRKDCQVTVASEGSDGYYKALENPPDIALIDVQMPGWDGLKTLKAFRSHPALAGVRAIMLTGDASKETVLAAIHAGANDYLVKTTFTKQDFFQKLNCQLPTGAGTASQSPSGAASPTSTEQPCPARPPHISSAETSPLQQSPESAIAAASSPASVSVPAAPDSSRLQEVMDNWD